MDDLIPRVHRIDALGGTDLIDGLRGVTGRLIRLMRNNSKAKDIVPTTIHGLYVATRAVEPHQDHGEPGMIARGLVISNEGHRLHSRRLDAAGVTEGLELNVGDVYEHDPLDEHWTTVPDGTKGAALAFYVTGEPRDRPLEETIEELAGYLANEMPHASRTRRAQPAGHQP